MDIRILIQLYRFIRKILNLNIRSSSFFTSHLLGRILFNLRLLEGRVLGQIGDFDSAISAISERKIEYSWVLRNLKSRGLILDVGSAESFLCYELSSRGGKIICVDIRKFKKKPKNIIFILADLCNLPFKEATFDTIIAVSTIEHVGLGSYGDPVYAEGDALAIKELKRILKAESRILLTTPFAKKHARYPGGRIYNFETLQRLSEGLVPESKEYYVPVKGLGWIKINEHNFKAKELIPEPEDGHGVACLALCKKSANPR